ncbi:MAG: CBS domain-containing protein [Marinilabiliales bacterium]|nr:CBS domain-containing protein [Marinilabiliales bacterium]
MFSWLKGESSITHDKDKAVLTWMDWKKEIETDLLKVKSNDTLGDLVKLISRSRRNLFPVVDEYNILEGVVSLDDVREIMFQQELYETTSIQGCDDHSSILYRHKAKTSKP